MAALDFDVAVIGAGPAGSTAALAMVKSGLRVAIIDQAGFPRDKICGDAVAAYASKVLATISPAFRTEFERFAQRRPVHTCRVFAPNGHWLDFRFSEKGNIIKRIDLDNFLFQLATRHEHVTPITGTRVNSVRYHQHDNRWELRTPAGGLSARLLIGCDGAN